MKSVSMAMLVLVLCLAFGGRAWGDTETPTPTPTDVDTLTDSPTPTWTPTASPTPTQTLFVSNTASPTITRTNTRTNTRTASPTPTLSATSTITVTPMSTPPSSDAAPAKPGNLGSVNQDVLVPNNKVMGQAKKVQIMVNPGNPGVGRLEIMRGNFRFRDLGSFNFPSGITAVAWDLTDEQGNFAPSGRYTVYFTDAAGLAHKTYILVIR